MILHSMNTKFNLIWQKSVYIFENLKFYILTNKFNELCLNEQILTRTQFDMTSHDIDKTKLSKFQHYN